MCASRRWASATRHSGGGATDASEAASRGAGCMARGMIRGERRLPLRTHRRMSKMHAARHRTAPELPAATRCGLCTGIAASLAAPSDPARRRALRAVLAGGAALAVPAWAREGVDVGKESKFTQLVPPEQVEQAAAQQ